jgi:hypothetical protein
MEIAILAFPDQPMGIANGNWEDYVMIRLRYQGLWVFNKFLPSLLLFPFSFPKVSP